MVALAQPRFGARLAAAMDRNGPLCVGIDPHPALLAQWDLPDDVHGLRTFAMTVVEALAGRVAALKPQSAFFERHGSWGVAVLEEVLAAVRGDGGGTQVILDAKRGDIGSTMQAYADAYLRPGAPLACDALTVSPYLGFGSLLPAVTAAAGSGSGLFVLALTSNPEGAALQHAQPRESESQTQSDRGTAGSPTRSVAGDIARQAAELNAVELAGPDGAPATGLGSTGPGSIGPGSIGPGSIGPGSIGLSSTGPGSIGPGSIALGSIGLVVGATTGSAVERLGIDLAAVRGPLLAPGIGAQGAGPAELAAVFGPARRAVLASTSRAVLGAGRDVAALRAAADAATQDAWDALRR